MNLDLKKEKKKKKKLLEFGRRKKFYVNRLFAESVHFFTECINYFK